jgi:hypothetical protein
MSDKQQELQAAAARIAEEAFGRGPLSGEDVTARAAELVGEHPDVEHAWAESDGVVCFRLNQDRWVTLDVTVKPTGASR